MSLSYWLLTVQRLLLHSVLGSIRIVNFGITLGTKPLNELKQNALLTSFSQIYSLYFSKNTDLIFSKFNPD